MRSSSPAFDSYTPSFQARTAIYVNKILKCANPSDLLVEPPTNFELINQLEDRKGTWPDHPPVSLVRADEVIE